MQTERRLIAKVGNSLLPSMVPTPSSYFELSSAVVGHCEQARKWPKSLYAVAVFESLSNLNMVFSFLSLGFKPPSNSAF